jgi:hypothetical protein
MKKNTALLNWFSSVPSCVPAAIWVRSFNPALTLQQAWNKCPSGLWMLWALSKIGLPPKVLMSAALVCVEGLQHHSEQATKINRLTRKYIGRHISKGDFADQLYQLTSNILSIRDKEYNLVRMADCCARSGSCSDYAADPISLQFMYYYDSHDAGNIPFSKEMADRIRQTVPFSIVKKYFDRAAS